MFINFKRNDDYTDNCILPNHSYLGTLLTYGSNAAASHLTNSFGIYK